MVRAVAFDLWETLITNTPELSRAQERLRVEAMAKVLGSWRGGRLRPPAAPEQGAARRRVWADEGVRPSDIHTAYRSVWDRCQELYWSLDLDVPCRRQIEHFLELLDLDPGSLDEATLGELESVYADAILEALPHIVEGAREALHDVRERGLRVGLISNTGRTPGSALREVLARLDLAPSIDAMVFSNEHGECKPRPSIFERLRESLDADYDEIVFVGDNLYVDVYGAQQCGMRAIHYTPRVLGTAVAPPVEHGLEIVADATIDDMRNVADALDRITAARAWSR
jgi:putative hydrolase of the HAD superfamily